MDKRKTRRQLLDELAELRQRVAASEAWAAERVQAEEALRESEREKAIILSSVSELVAYQDKGLRIQWQLAESEARYRQLVESPLVGIWQADAQGRFVFVNQRLAEMSGYAPEEAIGMSMLIPIAPELRPWLAERMQKRRAGELPPDVVEAEMVRKDGSRYTALVAPAGLYDSEGRFSGFIGALIDITRRKQLEQQLARQVEEQRRLVDLMAGRELRMIELKEVIRQLRAQLETAGLTPVADDPLAVGREDRGEGQEG